MSDQVISYAEWEIGLLQLQTEKEWLELERMKLSLISQDPTVTEGLVLHLDKKIFEIDHSINLLNIVERKKKKWKDVWKVFLYKWSTAHRFDTTETQI